MRNPEEQRIYLVLDNAAYNKSLKVKLLARQLGIRILYLPAYSPNLNPIERLWKFMKKKVMANHYFPDLKTFRKEIMLFMRGIRKYKNELSTLITDNFQIYGDSLLQRTKSNRHGPTQVMTLKHSPICWNRHTAMNLKKHSLPA